MSRLYKIEAEWDAEAKVWVAESEEVPGLVAEADSLPALFEKVRILVPELLALNSALEPGQTDVSYEICARHEETVRLPVAS